MKTVSFRPRVAFFDMAGCEGCQLAVLDCEDIFLDIVELVHIVEFREALSEKAPRFDIAFVEGSINREIDADRLHDIRARCSLLVALGACACHGNVQARSNALSPAESLQRVYGSEAIHRAQTDVRYWPLWAHSRVRAIHEVVNVDYALRGCPLDRKEFLHLIKRLVAGSLPRFAPQPVCVECKRNGNECAFERGDTCMGQITWGGCNAICINGGYRCDGCRGLLPYANLESHRALLREHGLGEGEINNRYRLFCSAEIEPLDTRA